MLVDRFHFSILINFFGMEGMVRAAYFSKALVGIL